MLIQAFSSGFGVGREIQDTFGFAGSMSNQRTKFQLWTVIEEKTYIRIGLSLINTLTNNGILRLIGKFPHGRAPSGNERETCRFPSC